MAIKKQAEVSSKKNHGVTPSVSVDSKTAVLQHAANELVFAVVGHVGSGTSTIANVLAELLSSSALPGGEYEVEVLSARNEIEEWAKSNGRAVPTTKRTDLGTTVSLQDLGDDMRLIEAQPFGLRQRLSPFANGG